MEFDFDSILDQEFKYDNQDKILTELNIESIEAIKRS